jgi:hypothetical protein
MTDSFIQACKKGNLKKAINIYTKHKPNIHTRDDEAFRYACVFGHINIAQWLYGLDDKPNIHADDDYAFRFVCLIGYINIAQWLYGLEDKPNIHALDDEAFRFTCSSGHINIAQWLYGLDDKPNIHAKDDEAFRFACYFGHINIAQWLYGLDYKPNIHAKDDYAFRWSCEKGHINIASWLSTICDDYHIEIENNKIKSWKNKISLQDLYDNKEYDKIIDKLKIEKKDDIPIETCSICYEDNSNFLTSCKHSFCVECFIMWYIGHNKKQCSYCMQNIDIVKCAVKNLFTI